MPEDRRLTISSSSRLHPDEVARRTFGTARRGFDPSEVRAYLEHVALEMAGAEQKEQELRDLLAETERRAQNPVLDEETLTTALGQETARVLRSAHEAAAELVGRAEADSNRMVTEAQEEAGKLQARVEQVASERAAQSEAAAAETRQRAKEQATTKVEAAHVEAETLLEQARVECRAMLSEAQELRARVLGDLTRRRRVLHSQIEQLRAGRDRLAETIGGVRQAVDRVTDDLFRAEDEARIAAEAAGRQVAEHPQAVEAGRDNEPVRVEGAHEAPTAEQEPVVGESGGAEAAATEPEGTRGTAASELDEAGTASGSEQSVEELFARLRAERSADVTLVVEESVPEDSAASSQEASVPTAGVTAIAEAAPARPERRPRSSHGSTSTAQTVVERHDDGSEEPGSSEGVDEPAREPLLVQRDDVLGPVAATLARRLKRALTDDQNDILDRLRAGKSRVAEVLAPEAEHIERYERAGREQLVEAARAGTTFGGGRSGDAPSIDDIAADLATAIVFPLRRRLEGDGAEVEIGDDAAAVEHVGAAFRDWKGERVERLAGDEATAAFSRGALEAAASGASLRWVFDDDGAECPDCDDNSLAGPVPRGEVFPTGHLHPPAHAGCRCLLAPVDA